MKKTKSINFACKFILLNHTYKLVLSHSFLPYPFWGIVLFYGTYDICDVIATTLNFPNVSVQVVPVKKKNETIKNASKPRLLARLKKTSKAKKQSQEKTQGLF